MKELALRYCQCGSKDAGDSTDSGKFAYYSVSRQNSSGRFENAGHHRGDGDAHSRRQDLRDIERLFIH